ncbi:MAG TPA: CxxxxCH/CxxCH domain-containing protein, partial [Geobacteraceae bacterium]|nr:CxxxxCH/CxxCH domain-containing protein [Geobacteraceae bacterium]
RYYYRVCVKDALGNISDGMTKYANAKVINICNTTPTVTLTGEDLLSTSQVVKSVNTAPFKLLISNNDIGTCPDAGFVAALTNEVAPANFDKKIGATEAAAVPFPATITLGTGGAGAPTGKTLNVYITGRPEANQLEVYKFAIQVTEAGHGTPPVTAQMTAMLNDMPPIVHNSSNMGKFQYGNWGQTYTCATCHSNSTTNIKGVYQIISTPIGRRNVVFTKTSSVDSDYTGVYGNDFRTQNNTSTNVCEVCHHQTRQHQYSASKPFGGPGNDEPYTTDHHNSRDCVACHTHNTAFRSIYGLCGDCHGFKGTGYSPVGKNTMVKDLTNSLGPNPPNYGAHQRHNTAKLTCAACHNNTNHGLLTTAWSGNNELEIGFLANKDTYQGFNPNATVTGGTFYGTDNLNAPFVWRAGPGTTIVPVSDYNASCNTYCHGTWPGNAPSVAPIWVGTGQVVCGTCHNATGAVPPNSGSHAKHAANSGAGLGIACNKCHATYASYTGSAHINGKVEWDLSAAYPGATYNGTTNNLAGSSTYSTCSNLYCHSNVQGANGTGGPTSYATPKWGDVTTAACGSCHVVPNNTGSHANHENAEVAFDCHVCHNTGGTTSPLNHANGKIDFRFNGLGQNTRYMGISSGSITPGTAYGTCSNSDCHGRFTRAWGTASSGLTMCEKCHGSATSARGFYNTRGPSGTLSVYSTGVGVHDIHIQNLNSPRKATFNRFTSYAIGFKCNQCHNVPTGPFTAGHIDTALPAEVPFSHVSSFAHKGDVYGYYSTPTYNFGTQACSNIWCHGAGMNSNRGAGAYAGTTPPVRTNPKWNVPYLTGNGSTDCTKCHALPPAAPDASYTHFGKTLNTCVSCHQHLTNDAHGFKDKSLHVNGKIDGGCDGCHGNPPITNVVGATDGLATPAQNALNGGAGAHGLHVNLPAIGNNCNTCHNSSDPAMPSNKLEIGFNGLNGLVTTGTFTGYTNSVNGPKWQSSSAGTSIVKSNVKAAICSNLYCHGGGTATLPVLGGGADIAPNWEGIKVCGDCHGVGTTNSTVPTGGSHLKHASGDNGSLGINCDVCHGPVADNGTHVDAAVTINLDRTNNGLGSSATYNINLNNYSTVTIAGLAPHASFGTCSVYCHSTVQGANGIGAGTFTNPTWGGVSQTCASCHKNMASDATGTGSHPVHAISSGYACGTCHHDGGPGTPTHTDGFIYTNFTSTVGGTYSNNGRVAGSAAGYGTCSATTCHGTVSPTWGYSSGKPKCEICHGFRKTPWNALNGNTANTDAKVGAHFNHISSNAAVPKLSKTLSCLECHSDSISNSTDSVASANHMNNAGTGKVKFGTLAGGTAAYATSTCSNVYCHGATLSGAAGRTNPVWNTPFLTGVASNDCSKCHGYPPQISAHIKTQPSTYYGPTECVNCHKHVNANGDGFTDPSLHINGNIEGGDCLSCHASVQGKRAAVVGQFASQSHHIQGAEQLTTAQCYQCHWEANSDGSVNATYHDKGQSANAGVSLVIWNGTTRPTVATMGT